MTASRPAISVVVMAYRNSATLTQAVESVLDQRAGAPFEVVVVTSGEDGAGDLVRQRFPGLRLAESPTRLLPGAARNLGVRIAGADLIAFLAADSTAAPGWVEGRLRAHADGHDAVASAVVPGSLRGPAALGAYYRAYSARLACRPPGPVRYPDPAAHGLSIRRSVFERLGPFREDMRVSEDTEYSARAAALGVPIWFEPAVRTALRGPGGLGAMLREQARRGELAAEAGWPDLPPLRLGPVAVSAVPMRSTAAILRATWRCGGVDRWRALAASPWILLACAGHRRGWRRRRIVHP